MSVMVEEKYCNFCGRDVAQVFSTNDDKVICLKCTGDPTLRFCETCGSTTDYLGQRPSEQKHYEEACLK